MFCVTVPVFFGLRLVVRTLLGLVRARGLSLSGSVLTKSLLFMIRARALKFASRRS